ncbi:MAG: DUF3800 domain-containing protein [Methanobrevibacter sp.]|jgi:hypothetical protein|nr:DUF3800 domain-containing protein [Methanobrevibacter sp.]
MYNLALDESGNMGSIENQFFIISILQLRANSYLKLRKIRDLLNKKFKRELRRNNEIKFHSHSNKFIKKALTILNETNFHAYSIVMDKNNALNKTLLKKYPYNEIYIDMVIDLLERINLKNSFILRIDQSLPRKHVKKLNSYIKNNPNIIFTENCEIFHNNSANYLSIQFADLISGSCFQYFEKGNLEFIDIFKDKHETYFYNKSIIPKK